MAELIPGLSASLRSDASRRFVALALIVAIGFVIWGIVHWASGPRWVNLFQQPLGLGEATQYTAMLDADGVPNRQTNNGGNIQVPANQLSRLRVEFAAREMGLSGCNEPPAFTLGSGSIEQELQRTRTIREHLNCTIARVNGISRAQVSLTLQEDSPFRRLRRAAKASVVIWPSRSARITDGTVESIAFMVSAAVDGLDPSQVAIINGNGGHSLQAPSDAGGSSSQSNRELAVQRGIESELRGKVERLLTPLMDVGEFQVQISAMLDWTEVVRRSERFDPEAQAIVKEENAEVPPGAAGPGSPSYTTETRESQYSRTIEDLTTAPGSIARLSVAVVVNEGADIFGDPAAAGNAQSRAQQLTRIESVVRAGVGFDAARGDVVTVTAIPFQFITDSTIIAAATPGSIEGPLFLVEMFLRPVLGLMALGLVGFLALRIIRSPVLASTRLPAAIADNLAAAGATGAFAVQNDQALARGNNAEDAEPDAAARVVKAWLQEA